MVLLLYSTINNDSERMDSTTSMEYYDGESWIPCLDNMSVSNMTGETNPGAV